MGFGGSSARVKVKTRAHVLELHGTETRCTQRRLRCKLVERFQLIVSHVTAAENMRIDKLHARSPQIVYATKHEPS